METLSDMFQEDVIRAEISRGVFCGFPSCVVLLNIRAGREHRLDTLRHASSVFPWAAWQSAHIQLGLFPSGGRRGCLPAKRALKRRPCVQRALYVIGLSCVSAVSCCVAFDLQQRWSPGDVAH